MSRHASPRAHADAKRAPKNASDHMAAKTGAKQQPVGRSPEELRALAVSLFTSQDEERRRIARQLHDDLSQRLAAIEIDGDKLEANLPPGASDAKMAISRLRAGIAKLSEDLRRMSQMLYPSIVEDLGLKAALLSLTEDFGARENATVTFSSRNVPQVLPPDAAIGLYRITQEALHNLRPPGGRTRAQVSLRGTAAGVELQIAFSGPGVEMHPKRPQLALVSMEERARHIGATFQLHSAPGDATRVTVNLPLSTAR